MVATKPRAERLGETDIGIMARPSVDVIRLSLVFRALRAPHRICLPKGTDIRLIGAVPSRGALLREPWKLAHDESTLRGLRRDAGSTGGLPSDFDCMTIQQWRKTPVLSGRITRLTRGGAA